MVSAGAPIAAALIPLQMENYLASLRSGFERANVIYRREDRIVIRWQHTETGVPIIIKMWSRTDMRGRLRRLLRISACDYEWRNLNRLYSAGVPVPRPLGFCRAEPSIAGYVDVLFLEDLGPCETGTEHLKRLIREGREKEAHAFEAALIDMTSRLLEGGMLDLDHGLINIIVPASGQPTKLDVELARRVFWPRFFAGSYGRMLGRLIGLYAFAVQPEAGRVTQFAKRLCDQLNPPRRALRVAASHAHKMMQVQLEKTGIDTRLVFPWN